MKYFEVITATKTWTCPKTGIYKIIAVGGGSSHSVNCYFAMNTPVSDTIYAVGGNTTFGSLLTAKGGVPSGLDNPFSKSAIDPLSLIGGAGGYTLQTYGGEGGMIDAKLPISIPPTLNGGLPGRPGRGYGAGGAAQINVSDEYTWVQSVSDGNRSIYVNSMGSVAGELTELIMDIDNGSSYSCTIGKGGAITESNIKTMFTNLGVKTPTKDTHLSKYNDVLNKFATNSFPGKSGCIVIEYLGESL